MVTPKTSMTLLKNILEWQMLDGYSIELNGYPDALAYNVNVTIRNSTNNFGLYYVLLSASLYSMSGYDIQDYVEIINNNFIESVIKDLGGAGAAVLEEQHYSYLACGIEEIETYEDNWNLACGRIYEMDEDTADDYTDMLGQPISALGGAYSVDFMFEESGLSIMVIPSQIYFTFMSENNDKNLCDYDWTMAAS